MLGNPRQSWIPGCGFWFRGTARFGFLVSGTWIPDSLIWILYFHKKLTWRNYRLIFYNAVTYRLQLVGIFWYIRLMLFDDEKVLGFFEIQFVGSPRSPPLTSSLRSVLSLKSSLIILTPVTPIQCCNIELLPAQILTVVFNIGPVERETRKKEI